MLLVTLVEIQWQVQQSCNNKNGFVWKCVTLTLQAFFSLCSGARTGHIHHHDVRVAEHHVATLTGHTQEVCGLKWSLDGRYLASGGNDNLVNVWPCTQGGGGDFAPVQTFTQHQGAVKVSTGLPQADICVQGWTCSTGLGAGCLLYVLK